MQDDQDWNIIELEGNIKKRFGKEQAARAWLSIHSIPQRLEHVAYHHHELIIISDKVESESKSVLLQRMFSKEDEYLNKIILQFSAPDYVLTSAFLGAKIMRLGHGFVWAAATAIRGTIAPMFTRRLNRYCTSAR